MKTSFKNIKNSIDAVRDLDMTTEKRIEPEYTTHVTLNRTKKSINHLKKNYYRNNWDRSELEFIYDKVNPKFITTVELRKNVTLIPNKEGVQRFGFYRGNKVESVAFYTSVLSTIHRKRENEKVVLVVPEFAHDPWEDTQKCVEWVFDHILLHTNKPSFKYDVDEILWICSEWDTNLQKILHSVGMLAMRYTGDGKFISFKYDFPKDTDKENKNVSSLF